MKTHYHLLQRLFLFSTLLIGSFSVKAQMSGSYIVGTSLASDFNTIQLACDSLKAQGVSGPVILNLESGFYSEFVLDSVSGVSSTNTITIQSQSLDSVDANIQNLNYSSVIHVEHVILNKLSFASVLGWETIFANSIVNLRITSCAFNNFSGAAINIHNSSSPLNTYAKNITIDRCTFNADQGIYARVEQVSNISITNSVFKNDDYSLSIESDFDILNVNVNNCLMNAENGAPLLIESIAGDIMDVDLQNTLLKGDNYGLYVYTDRKIDNINVNNVDFIGSNNGPTAFSIENDLRDINNINFSNVTIDSAHYGFYVSSSFNISDVSIVNASVNASYSGFYMESYKKMSNLTVKDATFDSTTSYVGYLYASHEMDNVSITKSSGTSSAREGLYVYAERNITNLRMDSVEFNGGYNSTSYEGVYLGSSQSIKNVNVMNSVFKGGRGMYVYGEYDISDVKIKNTFGYGKYSGSSSSGYGFGMEVYSGVLTGLELDNCKFFSDTGAAMSINCNDASFDWVVLKNSVIKTKGQYGVSIEAYAGGKNLQIVNCDIEATKAYGYGVYVYNSYVGLEDLVISDNTINTNYYGIYVESYYNNGMQRGLIENNTIDIDSVNNSGAYCIHLYSDTKLIDYRIKGNDINAANTTGGYGFYAGGYASGTSGLTIEGNNLILSGLYTKGIYVDYLKNNNTIAHNVIDVQGTEHIDNGLYLDGDYHTTNDLVIEGNVISNAEESIYGDEIRDFRIVNNTFRNESSNGGDGIDINDVDGGDFLISGNICYSFEGRGNSLELDDVRLDSTNKGIITNNFFGNLIYGASLDNVSNLLVANNTFTTSGSYNMLSIGSLCENIEVYNNIFQVDTANYFASLLYIEYPNQIKGMDYNVSNIDTAKSDYVYDDYYSNYYKDITDWSTFSGFDSNSFYEDVVFVNDTLDLHISCSNTSLMAGMPLPEVTVDVDGNVRGGTPYIGADEILMAGNDIFAQTSVDARQYTQYVLDAGGSSGNVTYNWNTGATTQSIIVDTTGMYSVTIVDACGSYSDSIYVQVGGFASINENELVNFNVYPNPSNGIVNLVVTESIKENFEVRMLSTSGRIVKRMAGNVKGKLTFDISNQANGLYIIQVITEKGISSRRLMKN